LDIFIFASEQWVLISFFLVFLYTFFFMERARGGKPIASSELVISMNADKAILVDVRSASDYQAGHIHGAINIPYEKTESRISELHKHKDKLIVLVDQMGQHAGTAGKVLSKDGFDVRRLSGGMSEWQHQNMPVVQGKKS
jgi:rhodanese-related sulfurtransferase